MSHDPHQLVGVPYTLWGLCPEVGFDCWTLVGYVRREYFGLKTPCIEPLDHSPASAMRAIRANRDGPVWKSVAWPGAPGDVVGMSLDKGGWLHHVGVILERGVLHAWRGDPLSKTGAVILTPLARIPLYFKQYEAFRCRT